MANDGSGGRPLNAKSGSDLKAAALSLIREHGYDAVSIAAIAKAAGVARQTLYNRWNTKADLVLEAVFEQTHSYAAAPVLDGTQPCRAVLEGFLINVFDHLNVDGDTLRALIAAAQQDAAFHGTFQEKFVLPRERMISALLQQAQERGELSSSRDLAMVSTSIHGVFWYRLLNGGALNRTLARDIVLDVFGTPPAPAGAQ